LAARDDLIRFAIVAAPRTGTNLLCTLLNSHPEILCHHEVFNPGGIYYALDLRDESIDLGTIAARDLEPLGFLERVYRTGRGQRCVGLKWTRGQHKQVLDRLVANRATRIIVVRRRNRLKVFASQRIAELTGQWEVYQESDLVKDRPKLRVDAFELRSFLSEYEGFYDSLNRALTEHSHPWAEVAYEDLLVTETQRHLLEFLGVDAPHVRLRPGSVKQNSTDLRDLFEDFDELAASLAGTGMEAELHDRGL
jgi:LPS sulfotransferase NodH